LVCAGTWHDQAVAEPGRAPRTQPRRAHLLERGSFTEYLALRLGGELFGIPLASVREILTLPPITYVPRAPYGILGLISVRGLLVTVIDLRMKVGTEAAPPTKRTRVLLVPGPENETLGLCVDEVLQVYRLSDGEIEPATSVLGTSVSEHVAGIGRREGVMLVLLSLTSLLEVGG
jgi:purine-binding chemotaxis protein CheW